MYSLLITDLDFRHKLVRPMLQVAFLRYLYWLLFDTNSKH